ncbi:hypothetical protein [Vitiosangium sp. GDMCC 1.1324]|uniref:hypothetical protein n=1 Tax=Vitiosangium sp. (strain GDMCC 1.1324) TaxID=2138576 RepID=UPI000D33C815|nr:hypothetical protein [Vitiosangium sp. GDMCC 1.1324]PTL75772.1 hypothetical protein DAT35_52935 [Vitiosangium sp. GDMCC 1.1324]
MFEPHDKKTKGGSRNGGPPNPPDQRRVVQPLSVVRGARPQATPPSPPGPPPPTGEVAAAEVVEQQRPVSTTPSSTLLHLWAMLNQRGRWSSLVVVPSHEGGSGVQAAQAILEVASKQGSTPVHFLDAEGLELGAAQHVVAEMMAYVEQGDRVVVLIDSVVANPVGLEVALAAERALLTVSLGASDYTSARRTLDLIGKERFLGSVTLQPSSGAPKK